MTPMSQQPSQRRASSGGSWTAAARMGFGTARVYLDWNAGAPLRDEARDAMLDAMDLAGNPSSVHAEGRAARAQIERARAQVAALVGCDPERVIFISGASEGARMVLRGRPSLACAGIEHEAVHAEVAACESPATLAVDGTGVVTEAALADAPAEAEVALQSANSETGVIQPQTETAPMLLSDMTQSAGRLPVDFSAMRAQAAILSGHKLGGPKGVGALVLREGFEPDFGPVGGGQEGRRRPGTENVVGIAGFGAAAEAAKRDVECGVWTEIARFRKILEMRLAEVSPETIIVGEDALRLPNTLCAATPEWRGETQVMQMDLAGYAISAGSACASGKVGSSRALRAMGLPDALADCAIRVSLGPATTEAEVLAFADAWAGQRRKRSWRAA
jgi:cysteine desulfurase